MVQAESVMEVHQAEMGELRRQIGELRQIQDDPGPANLIRQLRNEVAASTVREEKFKGELEDLRQAKEDARVEKEAAILEGTRKEGELRAKLRVSDVARATAERQAEAKDTELQSVQQANEALQAKVDGLASQATTLQRQVRCRTGSPGLWLPYTHVEVVCLC